MIDPVNEILRDLIQSRVPALAGPSQVGFEPPDDKWKSAVDGAGEDRLDIYLYEIREDLKYRTNDTKVTFKNQWLNQSHSPERLDCHYLVTAWSPMVHLPPAAEPTRDEHRILYSVAAVLMANRPLVPADVYAPGIVIPSGRTLSDVPQEIQQTSLPLETTLDDQIRNLGDFWGTMKVDWKPTVGLTVTIPVLPGIPDSEVAPVLTLGATWLQQQTPTTGEQWFTIGGRVLAGGDETPVAGAWVHINGISAGLDQVNRRVLAGSGGTFTFQGLRTGNYHLRTVAVGLGDIGRDVMIPSSTGEYDLRFP